MSSTQTDSVGEVSGSGAAPVAMALEAIVVPVADVDRAKAFYLGLGWRLDIDFEPAPGVRLVQVTPHLSPASIHFGSGNTAMTPGSLEGMTLVVDDIAAARDDLLARGVDVGEITHAVPGEGAQPGPDPDGGSYAMRASFSDPDGNSWSLQEITERFPGRTWS